MTEYQLDMLRDKTRRLCNQLGLEIVPYGNAWWIVGPGVSLVVAELAGVTPKDLAPRPLMARQ